MARRPPLEDQLPGPVAELLGPAVTEHPRAGECRVLSGGGLVAKIGPEALVAREAAVLATPLPLGVVARVDAGPGWVVTRAEADSETAWGEADLHRALADLARLHDAFEAEVPEALAPVLRRPFTSEGTGALLGPVRAGGVALPAVLAALRDDPSPLLAAAGAEPATLLHGDPWPANVLRPAPGRRLWIDWEHASVGPAAADLASWLDQTPWHIGRDIPGHAEVYLAARRRPVDRARFARALDAAAVLWFLAYDVPHLDGNVGLDATRVDQLMASAVAAAERIGG